MTPLEGSCHCGAVRIEVDGPPPDTVISCNCSICRRLGGLWAYYTADQVRVTGPTVGYVQGDRTLETHHCPTCACVTHWSSLDPAMNRTGVNFRVMDPQVLARARVRKLDGADTWQYLDDPD